MALKRLCVRGDLSGISVVRGVTEETGWGWLQRAASQAEESKRHRLRTLPVPQGPLDAMWNCMTRTHAREGDTAGASLPEGAEGRQGIGVRFAPACRLRSAAGVEPRTLDTAQDVVALTTARVAGMPACCSDGCTGYVAALMAAFHVVTTCARAGGHARPAVRPTRRASLGHWSNRSKPGSC